MGRRLPRVIDLDILYRQEFYSPDLFLILMWLSELCLAISDGNRSTFCRPCAEKASASSGMQLKMKKKLVARQVFVV